MIKTKLGHALSLLYKSLPLHIAIAGMHAWFAAAADTRYAVVVPIIGVQVVNPND